MHARCVSLSVCPRYLVQRNKVITVVCHYNDVIMGVMASRRRLHCLLNCWFRRTSKKTSKLRVTGLCGGNSPMTGEFSAQRASNAANVSIWWRHHGQITSCIIGCLLYGSNNVNLKSNIEIFKHFHKYISETKRLRIKQQIYEYHHLAYAWRNSSLEDAFVQHKFNSLFTMVNQRCKKSSFRQEPSLFDNRDQRISHYMSSMLTWSVLNKKRNI